MWTRRLEADIAANSVQSDIDMFWYLNEEIILASVSTGSYTFCIVFFVGKRL